MALILVSGVAFCLAYLTTALGSSLVKTLYILDEPSIGLHPRDNARLLATLQRLKAQGNSIVVVEHDEATMRSSDHVIGHGGEVVIAGPPDRLLAQPQASHMARFLRQYVTCV